VYRKLLGLLDLYGRYYLLDTNRFWERPDKVDYSKQFFKWMAIFLFAGWKYYFDTRLRRIINL
jgi:hypothetical protein